MAIARSLVLALALSATGVLADNHIRTKCESKCAARWGAPVPNERPMQHDKPMQHAGANTMPGFPFHFTSTFAVHASPDNVINSNQTAVAGEPGGQGWFNFGINSHLDIICYNITLAGVTPPFASPAKTATHIHEAAVGRSGPPRLAFPNPEPREGSQFLHSVGCLTGPFTTGLAPNGTDTGLGFTLSQIEANPAGFFADTHTEQFRDGAVRGQLA